MQVDREGPRRFTPVPPLVSVEGRVQDAVLRPDGALVTAGAIDRALGGLLGLAIFQVNQRTPDAVEIDVVAEAGYEGDLVAEATRALAPLFAGLATTARTAVAIAAEPSGKFRVSRRHFGIDLGRTFEGCEGAKIQ